MAAGKAAASHVMNGLAVSAFHRTNEQGKNCCRLHLSVRAAVPAVALAGKRGDAGKGSERALYDGKS